MFRPLAVPVFGAVAAVLLTAAPLWAEGNYSAWKKNAAQNRYECSYSYETKDGKKAQQTVIAYPKDNPRYGWAYYHNAEGKPWARCAVKGNPKYSPKQMYWQQLKPSGDGYQDYKKTAGYCPAPADGKQAIPPLPDPPV